VLADSDGVVLPHTDLSAALEEKDRQASCLPQKLDKLLQSSGCLAVQESGGNAFWVYVA